MVKNFVERLMFGLCFDAPDGGSGGGTPDGNQPADNNGATGAGDDNGQVKLDSAVKPGAAPVKPAEDPRIKGFIADLQKERVARQRLEAAHQSTAAELAQERKRIQALVGVNPRSDEETEEELVRARLGKLYPALSTLTPEKVQALIAMEARMTDMQTATDRQWQSHGRKMLDSVTSSAEKALGGGKLSDRQSDRIRRAYVAEAEANPEFLARHEAGDATLVEQFVKEWVEDFGEPFKRQALNSELSRQRRVPSGRDRSIVGAGEKKIDVNDPKQVEDFLVKSYRDKGGQFTRQS